MSPAIDVTAVMKRKAKPTPTQVRSASIVTKERRPVRKYARSTLEYDGAA